MKENNNNQRKTYRGIVDVNLGSRELEVLDALWKSEKQTVVQLHAQNIQFSQISIHTMQSTLERLFRKRLVDREKQGRHYCYWTIVTKTELITGLLDNINTQVAGGDLMSMCSAFIGLLERKKER